MPVYSLKMKTESIEYKSLAEVHGTVNTLMRKGIFRKLLSFMGPAYLVSVGYMDPGNWATDIAGGSKFGYALLWVLVMSNLMALLLQSLTARLGLVRGLDLAQVSRATYPKGINFILWILAELAIASTDLAEVVGMAIGLQLLFGLDLIIGVTITVFDSLLLLLLLRLGIRLMEAFILSLVGMIGISFLVELIFAGPEGSQLVTGLVPSLPGNEALYIAIGIIGATVMPHNLYLHSSLVQTRKIERTHTGIKKAIFFNFIDTAVALNLALFVNGAILILAAASFYSHGFTGVDEIQTAHKLLEPVLGSALAPALFAFALIMSGQSSTLTGTLSGQIVMEGYLNIRIQPWIRRLITRIIAIIPAYITIIYFGEDKTGELLVLSQVVLSLQLGFAVIPLIHFTSDKEKMGKFAIKPVIKILAWSCALIIVGLNVRLIFVTIEEWLALTDNKILLMSTIVPVAVIAGILLLYITLLPFLKKPGREKSLTPHGEMKKLSLVTPEEFRRIAVTVDFSDVDSRAVSEAIKQGGKNAQYLLIHIVETAGALMMKDDIRDFETSDDVKHLKDYLSDLSAGGYDVHYKLGYGNPKQEIPAILREFKSDLLVIGMHGHRTIKDIIFGTTLEAVRHAIDVPVLIVRR